MPRPSDRSRLLPVAAGLALLGPLLLLAPPPTAAASQLSNPTVSPPTGTTATNFILSVDYSSSSPPRNAQSVSVQIVGLGGGPLPMSLVAGELDDGTWATTTMLPAGSWQLVFSGSNDGPPNQQPTPIDGPIVTVTTAPTPSPTPVGQTPEPTSSPTPEPSATPAPPGTATPRPPPTPAPTPLPPGVTPGPAPTPAPAPPGSTPATPPESSPGTGASQDPSGSDPASPGAGESPASAAGSDAPEPSPEPSADEAGDETQTGWGRTGWVVLGSMTSVAGLVVIGRQWLVPRAGTASG